MKEVQIYLCRHGETAWTLSGQHTGVTDIPLTENGKEQAVLLGDRLQKVHFTKVFSSPRIRALETCKIAGFKDVTLDSDLQEVNYGKYEGLTRNEIRKTDPNWHLFVNGAPSGETLAAASARADRFLSHLKALQGNIAIFSHGHFSRILALRWLGLETSLGRFFSLAPASLSILSFERETPVIKLWNDLSHLSKE